MGMLFWEGTPVIQRKDGLSRFKLGRRCPNAFREGSEGSSRLHGRHQNLFEEALILETPKPTRQAKHMEANHTHTRVTLWIQ